MTLTISKTAIEVKKVADFLSNMDNGSNDNGRYTSLIEGSAEKRAWIEENFSIVRGTLDVADLDEAFEIIEK